MIIFTRFLGLRGVPQHDSTTSASSRATLLSGSPARKWPFGIFRPRSARPRHLLLRANRRSPAFRSAIPRRHVVQSPSIAFPRSRSVIRQLAGDVGPPNSPEIKCSTHDLSTEIQRQTKDDTGQQTPVNDAQRAGELFLSNPLEHPPPRCQKMNGGEESSVFGVSRVRVIS